MAWTIRYAGLSEVGLVRDQNEDAWGAVPEMGLFVLADGMGGHFGGETAARMVVEGLPALVRKRLADVGDLDAPRVARRLRGAVSRLSRDVFARGLARPELRGMGATVVAALVRGGQAMVAHLGDSRAYLFREGKLKQLTRDHSVAQELIDRGLLRAAEAADHPSRHCITQSVGMPGEVHCETKRVPLRNGDRLLLCSDGLAGVVEDGPIARLLAESPALEEACRGLIRLAYAAGGPDNVTAVLIEVAEAREKEKGAEVTGEEEKMG